VTGTMRPFMDEGGRQIGWQSPDLATVLPLTAGADTQPAHSRLWDYITNFGDAPLPLGSLQLGPQTLFGYGGPTVNDVLNLFTDSRKPPEPVLPETISINDVGRSLAGLAPGEVTRRHYDAMAGTDSRTGEPVSGLSRLMDLFPAAGAEGGAPVAAMERGGMVVGSGPVRRFSRFTQPMPDGFELPLVQHPTRKQAADLLATTKNSHLRGLVDPESGEVVLWDAVAATHDQVAEALGMDWQKIIANNGRLNIKNPGQLDYMDAPFAGGPDTPAPAAALDMAPESAIPTGSDLPPEVPGSPSATPSAAHPMIGETFTDQFAAMKLWKEAGGKNGPIKITGLPEGAKLPTSWRIDANEAAGAGAVPTAAGGHGVVGHGPNLPGSQPVSAKDSVDRRGLPGRDPLGPRTPLGITDPEGRPLYAEALIAGIRAPGGPDVPLSMPEEVRLAERLAKLETPKGGILGANGQVLVAQPGTMDPPGSPLLHMRVDADLPDGQYMKSFRHEGGHAIDYSTERTQRGFESSKQYAVPDDVRAELHAASAEMRPELWAPNANEIYQRPTSSLKEYRERPDELMADGYRFYKENPAEFKARYPEAARYIRSQVNDDPLLSGQVQFNVRAGAPIPPPDDVEGDARAAAQQNWIVRHLLGGGA
jgi:hypothetical protein